MSQDVQLAFPCPHLTVEERVPLGSDRRSLETLQPVAAQGSVRILINDQFFVPQGGLYTPASVTAFESGPFRIVNNENQLIVRTATDAVVANLPIGERVPTNAIVSAFQQVSSNIAVENINGHLTFTDLINVGLQARIQVEGSAATSVGFTKQTGGQGKDVYPPWQLVVRPDTITNRFPQFRRLVKTNPMIKVTYSVPVQRCRRCRGTGIENDARFDPQGQIILIENENLLYQAALKILLTERGSNPYNTWYGTTLQSKIGSKALSAIATIINEDVRSALRNLQTLQLEQSRYQAVPPKERLYQILSVQTSQSSQDPTVFLVEVIVQNASSEPISLSVVFTAPGVVAMLNGTTITPG